MFNGNVYGRSTYVTYVICTHLHDGKAVVWAWCTHHCLNIKDFDAGDNNAYYRIIALFSK